MRLTRRDLMAALAAVGVGGAALLAAENSESDSDAESESKPLTDNEVETVLATAEVIYPSEVEDVDEFVRSYVLARVHDSPDRAEGLSEAVGYLDTYSESWYGDSFAGLEPEMRDEALRAMGADTADPDPGGSGAEAVRYHVINELLFALYTTPTGGELVGLENPQGHPGGTASYRRGPDV